MSSPAVTLEDWRALVEKELAGVAFDKALVHATPEGIALQPLYTALAVDPGAPGAAPFTRGASAAAPPFQICMRVDRPAGRRPEALAEDLDGGADALWVGAHDIDAIEQAGRRGLALVLDDSWDLEKRLARVPDRSSAWLGCDPISAVARGALGPDKLLPLVGSLAGMAEIFVGELPRVRPVRVSSLVFHDAGADAADELALILATAAAYLRGFVDGGLAVDQAARALWVQVAVGGDTFGELCKLRALRVVWGKLFAAAGVRGAGAGLDAMHAVCSSRTQSQHDPWVNLLRVTTQVFAAALGGAQLVTPLAFDEALGSVSPLGRRAARNTALVLREESQLGRVVDAAGGAYYIEARTDLLARAAWSRFQAIEREGGIVPLLASGGLRDRLEAAWSKRAAAIARRKEPVLGVSEFANLNEQLPVPVPAPADPPSAPALRAHRDAEGFEALRARVEAAPRSAVLVTLGPPAEHRARVGYASALFATAGLRARELAAPDATAEDAPASAPNSAATRTIANAETTGDIDARNESSRREKTLAGIEIACLCGSDERYAVEAVAQTRALRAAGARKIVLAGRPGALEAALRAAGVDAFIFVGCDALATLTELVGGAA